MRDPAGTTGTTPYRCEIQVEAEWFVGLAAVARETTVRLDALVATARRLDALLDDDANRWPLTADVYARLATLNESLRGLEDRIAGALYRVARVAQSR
jgi:hypothetical protein